MEEIESDQLKHKIAMNWLVPVNFLLIVSPHHINTSILKKIEFPVSFTPADPDRELAMIE